MAKRGKPLPGTLKLAEEPGDRDSVTPRAGRPVKPDHLDLEAADEWDRMLVILDQAGVLTPSIGPALAIYCRAHSRAVLASADLAATGYEVVSDTGATKANPSAGVVAKAEAVMLKVLTEFGLTPSSRRKIKTAEKTADPLAEFLARRGQK
jgi:P27 family predicted phage terminase small subunit